VDTSLWTENFSVMLRGVTDLLKKLREAWRQLESAKKSVNNAQTHKTDAAVVFGCTGFAIEHINKARQLIEEVAKDLKRR
jgi:hypothetical protein